MAWIYLITGMLISLAGNFLLKASNGYENLFYGISALCLFVVGIGLYGFAIKVIPLNVAYVIWTGLSVLAVVLIGIFAFNEKITLLHILFISLILIGSFGLKYISKV